MKHNTTIDYKNNDEWYTPSYAVTPIIKYLKLKKFKKIWCPFDTNDSNFVKDCNLAGFEVFNTHISSGGDFFTTLPPDGVDVIVSNPPYSLKYEVLDRLIKLKIPFAMLMSMASVFDNMKCFDLFNDNLSFFEIQLLILNKRINFLQNYSEKPSKNISFKTIYFCSDILPKQICFEKIIKE